MIFQWKTRTPSDSKWPLYLVGGHQQPFRHVFTIPKGHFESPGTRDFLALIQLWSAIIAQVTFVFVNSGQMFLWFLQTCRICRKQSLLFGLIPKLVGGEWSRKREICKKFPPSLFTSPDLPLPWFAAQGKKPWIFCDPSKSLEKASRRKKISQNGGAFHGTHP